MRRIRFLDNTRFMGLILAIVIVGHAEAHAEQFDGYTEPYDSINVAAAEAGIVQSVEVREGEVVEKGQVLVRLDDDLHLGLLTIAEESMRAKGGLNSALAELNLHKHRLEKIQAVRERGHASEEEVVRATADVAMAEARLLSARESLLIKKLEHKKIKIQIERRVIRAPMGGVITKIHKKGGEYVGPNDPHVLEMVKLNPLLAKFPLPSPLARRLREGQPVKLFIEPTGKVVNGTIEFVGPVTDAQSSTVQVKARIDNPDGQFYSGERCTIQLPDRGLAKRKN